MSAAGLEDVEGVDADFFAKFEEEFKEHQDSERKKKRTKPFRSRKGSQTPPAHSSKKSRKRARPQTTKKEPAKGNKLPNVAWGTPSKGGMMEDVDSEFERLTDVELITKTIQLPYLKQLQYVDIQLNLHRNLLDDRDKAREEKQAHLVSGEETLILSSPSHSPSRRPSTPTIRQQQAQQERQEQQERQTSSKQEDGVKVDDDGGGGGSSPTTHSPTGAQPTHLFGKRTGGSSSSSSSSSRDIGGDDDDGTMSIVSFDATPSFNNGTTNSGVAAPTNQELRTAAIDPAIVFKKYSPFLSMVEPDAGAIYLVALSAGRTVLWEDMTVIPVARHGSWFLQFIEEVYDARFKFEYGEWREGKPKKKRARRGEKKEEIDSNLEFEGVELHRSPAEFFGFVHGHIATQFGLRALVRQLAWDLVFTIEQLSEPDAPQYLEEARLFGFFLRGVYTWKSLLFFLFARDSVQSMLRVQLSARTDKLLDTKYVQRAAASMTANGGDLLPVDAASKYGGGEVIPEHSMLVVEEEHPTMGGQWNVLRLSKAACHRVCERIFHNDRVLAEYLFSSLLNPEAGDPRHGVLTYALLLALLEDFRGIPDEFAASMQEDDTAETVNMLHGLKEASGSDDKIAEIVLRIKDETLSLQEQKNLVGALERDNDDNKNRTSIFLSKNELWRRQMVLETSEKALRAIQEHEDEAWGSVISKSDENIRKVKRDREKRRPPTIPSELFNLGEVVELMHAWTKKRRDDELRSLATLAKLKPLNVEEELERLRLKAIIQLQREWRSRLAARKAKEEADKFLEIKRQQRLAKLEEQRKREEAINKRRRQAEKKRKQAEQQRQMELDQEEARRLKAIQDAKRKVANKNVERKFAAKMKELTVKCFAAMKRYGRTRILRRKVMREDTRRRFKRWGAYARAMKNQTKFKNDRAEVIQRFARFIIARNIVKHARARLEREQQIVGDFLRRIMHAHTYRAYMTWYHHARQIRSTRNMLRRHVMGIAHVCMNGWKEATKLWIAEENLSATKLQAMYRARNSRNNYKAKLRRHNAASSIQRMARAHAAKRIVHRAKAKQRRDERRVKKSLMKIKMRLESQTLRSWYDIVWKKKKAKRFLQKHMREGIRVCYEKWHEFAQANAEERLKAVILVQKLWRGHVAGRLGKKLLKNTRAAIIIQTFTRQFLNVDTLDWLRLYRDAATEIQRIIRHRIAYNEFVRIRIANYFKAAEKGDFWTCNKAWDRGEGNEVDEHGDNLLMCAARGGSKRVAKLCLRNGMDINAYNKIGLTAIHHLCRATYLGQEVLLDYLMSKGAKHKSVDFSGATPLMEAARLGHMECVTKLIESHADINHRDNDGCSVVQVAAAANQLEVVRFLASECDADVGNIDNTGCNVLHDTATRGRYAMVEIVIPHLYDLDVQDSHGATALHLAVAGNHDECVRILLLAACDSNIIDDFGRTALHHSVFAGQTRIARLIAEADTDLSVRDEDGDTALHAAVISGHFDITKMLLGTGADHSIRNDNGDQPAHLAARKGYPKPLKILMEYEANMNMKNFNGLTPLGEARVNNRTECVHLFDSLFINEAEAKAKVKREKKRLARLNGKEVEDDDEELDDPTCARRQEDWRMQVPLTANAWARLRKGSILHRRIHKWMEYHYSDKDDMEQGNAEFAKSCMRLGRPPPTYPIYTVVFWYNSETKISVADPPDDLIYGVWLQKQNEDGTMYWINDITGERHEGSLPPNEIHTSQIRKMRVLPHLEAADVSSADYKSFWEEEMAEGNERRLKLQAAEMIQRQYRAYRGRVFYTELKKQNIAAIQMQRAARGFLGRATAKNLKIQIKAVLTIQKNWRGREGRQKIEEMKAYMTRRRAVLRASALINRVWRGYLCRRTKRRMIWRRDGPRFYDQWQEMVGLSTVRRIVGVWDEMICPDTYDVLFYHNHLNKATDWDKPTTVEEFDEDTYEDDRMLRLQGFTRKEDQAARWLQGIWRGRIIRRTFKFMVRGARIMRNCEDEYLADPNNPVNLCNYMLYLHIDKRDYVKARPLYARALEMMSSRGPDNAFILYAYAMFVTATREEDFDEVMAIVQRAHVANATGENRFSLAEKGFFRQVAVLNPKNGQAQANYAICLQFLRHDYEQAEELYIKALEADPYDEGIVENFNNMLTKMARKPYDGFDAFRRHQANKARNAAVELAAEIADEKAVAELAEKMEAAQKIIRWHNLEYGKKTPFWKFTPPAAMLEAKAKEEAAAKALAKVEAAKAARKAAAASGQQFEDADEDPEDWEECSDGLGGVYYFNLLTGESSWTKPKFEDEDVELQKGVGFEGMRGGRMEDVADWEECMDDQGKHYYYNIKNGRSQWIRPRFKQKHAHPVKGAGFGDAVKELKEKEKEGPKEKPSIWQEHTTEDERTYWWNSETGVSSWITPNFMTEAEEKAMVKEEEEKKKKDRDVIIAKLKVTTWEVSYNDSGDVYYYNTATGESTWELDVDAQVDAALAQVANVPAAVASDVVDVQPYNPADWEENVTETGDKYWYNVVSGESSWNDPSTML